jgi:hypothetical protein
MQNKNMNNNKKTTPCNVYLSCVVCTVNQAFAAFAFARVGNIYFEKSRLRNFSCLSIVQVALVINGFSYSSHVKNTSDEGKLPKIDIHGFIFIWYLSQTKSNGNLYMQTKLDFSFVSGQLYLITKGSLKGRF